MMRTLPAVAVLAGAALTSACTPTVRVEVAPISIYAKLDADVRLRLSGYATTDLVSGIKVTDSKFVMSPTPLLAAGAAWPGAAGGGTDVKINDWLLVEGRQRAVVQVDNVRIGDVLVRIEGRISG